MTQPSVQQSILKSLCRNFRVSGALHSFRPVPPVIFEAGFSTYTATLKSISLTLSGCQRRQPSSPLADAVSDEGTCVTIMLSGFKSRWQMLFLCKYSVALNSCAIIDLTVSSLRPFWTRLRSELPRISLTNWVKVFSPAFSRTK